MSPLSPTNNFNTPAEICDLTTQAAVRKANMPLLKMLILGIWAGVFIALGGVVATVAMHDISNVGLSRLVGGCVFPVCLIMVIMLGSELFTGNCLMVSALCERKIGFGGWMKNLAVVYVGNFIGSLIIAGLMVASTLWNYTDGGLGAFAIKMAITKTSLPFGTALASGILCNILVCAAVLLATGARDAIGKIIGAWFPVMAFAVSGFEHSIANMYYIFSGVFAAGNPKFVDKAAELYGVGADGLAHLGATGILSNLVPVTLGNIIGGVALGLCLWLAFKSRFFNKPVQA